MIFDLLTKGYGVDPVCKGLYRRTLEREEVLRKGRTDMKYSRLVSRKCVR